jgi:hypothetical protein
MFRSPRAESRSTGILQVWQVPALTSGQSYYLDENASPMVMVNRIGGNGDMISINNRPESAGTVRVELNNSLTQTYEVAPGNVQSQNSLYYRNLNITCVNGSFTSGQVLVYIQHS